MKICAGCGAVYDNLYNSQEMKGCPVCGLSEIVIELKQPKTKLAMLNDCSWTEQEVKIFLETGNITAEEGARKL